MTARDDAECCAAHGCKRTLVGVTVVTARDGKRYCKRHADRLPPYLRKAQRVKKRKQPHDTEAREGHR